MTSEKADTRRRYSAGLKAQVVEACNEPGAPEVRLVAVVNAKQSQVLMTNLDHNEVPAGAFAALYHQRWRIEEAFKRTCSRATLQPRADLKTLQRCGLNSRV